jgi:Rne/Rng family ribonuclease
MKKEMLINVLQPEECRIAILEDGTLEELYIERTSQESYVGNVYKGRIVNIEPSIQAAFVDFGIGRNGFLHVSDVDPAYYKHLANGRERGGPRRHEESDRPRRGGRGRGRGRQERPQDDPSQSRPEGEFDEFASMDFEARESQAYSTPDVSPARRMDDDIDLEQLLDAPRPKRGSRESRGRHPQVESITPAHGDDPYAGLMNELGGIPTHEEPDDRIEESAADTSAVSEEIPSGKRRPKRDEEASAAPPAGKSDPTPTDDSSFGEGIDLWNDKLPPPYVRGAERRTEVTDEFDSFSTTAGGGDGGYDQPREPGRHRGPRHRHQGGRRAGRDGTSAPKPNIQDIFKRGQEVIVQVIKEGIGTKGPTLSTYISIAGRYLVLMPGLSRIGVSRKISDEDQRHRLKDILTDLNPPPGLGFIIRTAGTDRNKKELQNDLAYLLRIWQVIVRRIKQEKSPAALHQESDMITRTIRDTFTADVDAIWIDEELAFQHAREFLQGVMPRYANRLKLYESREPLFHHYGIENEIAKIQLKKLPLPNGGSIIIEQAEALVAIDVNSGNFRTDGNSEETAFQINLQAAKEIARQLRLRDLGGVIVNDFIDMKDEKHRRALERAMRDAVKRDRARTKLLRISQFGLIEMTRQRIRPSIKRSMFQDCPHCSGLGHVKTTESVSIEAMRLIQLASYREQIRRLELRVHTETAHYLLNRKRRELASFEERGGLQVAIVGMPEVSPERLDIVCFDAQNNEVPLKAPERSRPEHRGHNGGRRR